MIIKKAQVTLFIILGVMLVFIVGIGYYFVFSIKQEKIKIEAGKSAKIPFSVDNVNYFLENCFKNMASEAVEYVSLRGGYFTLPKKSYSEGIINTAFYFYEDSSFFPKIEVLENSISEYIKAYGNNCFEELKNITEYGTMEYKLENISAKILENNIKITIYAPTKIQFEFSTHEIVRFNVELNNNRLYDTYIFSDYLIKTQVEDKYSICLSCIINKGTENNFSVDIENVGDGSHIFILKYNDSITGVFYNFVFANKYKEISCSSLPIDAEEHLLNTVIEDCAKTRIESYNYSLFVEDIGTLQAYVNVPFTTKILTKGLNLEYFSYTDLFEIDSKTGVISFTPTEEQIGEHTVFIRVKDQFGNEELKEVTINISKV